MRVMIDMGHPAHVHFFKNAIWELEKLGHQVRITARDKDIILQLLEHYGFEYVVRPSGWRPINLFRASKFVEKQGKGHGVDVYVGVHNPYVAIAAKNQKKKCVLFTDTPGSKIVNRYSVDIASKVCTPDCLAGMFRNQVTYPGYKEMAYLHPRVFQPNGTALKFYGLKESDAYFMVRFIDWKAFHDTGKKGMSNEDKESLVKQLSSKGKVLVSSEGDQPVPSGGVTITKPEHIHDLLNYSSGYVGEGASMAKEAAMLGVPSVYVSALQGLPPIDVLTKEKRITSINKYDKDTVIQSLLISRTPLDMLDVSSKIVELVWMNIVYN